MRVSVSVAIHDLNTVVVFVGEGKERERATCPRICASSSVVRPIEREATEKGRPARRRVRDRAI